jgi:hypothetical protein
MANIRQMYLLLLSFSEPMEAHGCDGHLSVQDHQILAEQLTPFFKKMLK